MATDKFLCQNEWQKNAKISRIQNGNKQSQGPGTVTVTGAGAGAGAVEEQVGDTNITENGHQGDLEPTLAPRSPDQYLHRTQSPVIFDHMQLCKSRNWARIRDGSGPGF